MASATAHFIIGSAIALPALRWRVVAEVLPPWKIVLASGLLAAAPDLDLGEARFWNSTGKHPLSSRTLPLAVFSDSGCGGSGGNGGATVFTTRVCPIVALMGGVHGHSSASRRHDRRRRWRDVADPVHVRPVFLSMAPHPHAPARHRAPPQPRLRAASFGNTVLSAGRAYRCRGFVVAEATPDGDV